MRVVVNAREQRKIIEAAKRQTGLTWQGLAAELNVSENTIRHGWRHQVNFIPQASFNRLLKLSNLASVKTELRPDNWGQRLGAITANKKRSHTINLPKKDEKLSELIGIILGDGSIFADKKRGIYYLRIFFDSEKEAKYANYVGSLLNDVFGVKPDLRKHRSKNCIFLALQNKGLVEYLEKKQKLLPGDKIKNGLTIPRWIWRSNKLLRCCVRGLIDTDGSIYRLTPHWPNLIQIQFKNHNRRLLNDARNALVRLGFNPSKVHSNRIVLTRQKEINKYIKEIGTVNKTIALSSSGQEGFFK